jgi:hypothetical protein
MRLINELITLFQAETRPNNTYEFSPYLKENTIRHLTITSMHLLTLLKQIIPMYNGYHIELINRKCRLTDLKRPLHMVTI